MRDGATEAVGALEQDYRIRELEQELENALRQVGKERETGQRLVTQRNAARRDRDAALRQVSELEHLADTNARLVKMNTSLRKDRDMYQSTLNHLRDTTRDPRHDPRPGLWARLKAWLAGSA